MKHILEHNEADRITEAEHQALLGHTTPQRTRPRLQGLEMPTLSRVERCQRRRRKSWWQRLVKRLSRLSPIR